MTRRLAALLLTFLLLCPWQSSAAGQTCIVVTVRDQGGAGIPNVVVRRDGGNARVTDSSGAVLWCVAVSQTAAQLAIEGTIVGASATNGTAALRDGVVYVAWLRGTDPVNVTITASHGGATPTPSGTPAPTRTLQPTATIGPSPTAIPTPTPWDGWYDASAIVEIEPVNPPGRYAFRIVEAGGVEMYMQTCDGDDYPSGCGVDCTSLFGWARLYFRCDCDEYTCPTCPPMPPVIVITQTPTYVTNTPTANVTVTMAPTPATGPTLTLDQDIERMLDRCEVETGTRPFLFWVVEIEGAIRDLLELMDEAAPGRPYLIWWSR